MKESTTYQAILQEGREVGREEGRADEAQAVILRLGRKRFGLPTPETEAALGSTTDRMRLERRVDRILEVESWNDLLATD